MSMPTAVAIDVSAYQSIGELLRDVLIQHKSETALIEVSRKKESKRFTYAEFKREAAPVIAELARQGVSPGDRVAIIMTNQSRWLVAAYAVFYLGATLVPLDYKLSAAEQEALLAHCKPVGLITEHGMMRRFSSLELRFALVSEMPANASYPSEALSWDDLAPAETLPAFVTRAREDLATIVYSSGTGGRPKGCMLSHEAYLTQLDALLKLFPMRPGHRYFSILPTNHAIDFMVGFLGPFCCGATVVHQRTLRPEFLLSTMKAYEITHMALVPLILSAFENAIKERLEEQPRWRQRIVDVLGSVNEELTKRQPNAGLSRRLMGPIHAAFGGKLELLFCGGAFVDRERAEFFYRLGLPVVIGYGLTEVCTVATVNDLRPFRADSVGRAVDGVEIKIHQPGLDGVGEVWIRGRTMMMGYLDDPELTARTINADGWLQTGDLGWLDAAHHLHLVGRSKNMIVTTGGKNVYPEDIEGAFEGLPCEELAVFASGYLWPREQTLVEECLVAVVRPKANPDTRAELRTLMQELQKKNSRLPDHKRIREVLPWSDDFPRTASMKVKRESLATELRERADRQTLVEVGR